MTARSMLSTVGAALGGVVGLFDAATQTADAGTVRRLLADLGIDSDDLDAGVRRFQRHAGLVEDGLTGPRTVHLLVRYAAEARDLDRLHLAA